jgi:pilus assembly protein TadC
VAVLAGLLCGAAVLVLLARPPEDRLARVLPGPARRRREGPARRRREGPRPSRAPGPTGACLAAGAAAALLLPLPLGLGVGAAVALAGPRALDRLEPRAVREERERLAADTPLVLELLAACLAGGAPPAAAATASTAAVQGPAGARLSGVAAALAVGSPPGRAWTTLGGGDPADPLAPAARALARAAEGGAPVAAAMSGLAAEARADARSRGEQAARRVGVLAVAPLGLCFLPAFVLLGVVPVVIGLVGPLLATF